jgi:hypothetical protein
MSLAKSRGAQKKATTKIAATTVTAFVARLMPEVVSLVRFTSTHGHDLSDSGGIETDDAEQEHSCDGLHITPLLA